MIATILDYTIATGIILFSYVCVKLIVVIGKQLLPALVEKFKRKPKAIESPEVRAWLLEADVEEIGKHLFNGGRLDQTPKQLEQKKKSEADARKFVDSFHMMIGQMQIPSPMKVPAVFQLPAGVTINPSTEMLTFKGCTFTTEVVAAVDGDVNKLVSIEIAKKSRYVSILPKVGERVQRWNEDADLSEMEPAFHYWDHAVCVETGEETFSIASIGCEDNMCRWSTYHMEELGVRIRRFLENQTPAYNHYCQRRKAIAMPHQPRPGEVQR